jgi:hypothetical protein
MKSYVPSNFKTKSDLHNIRQGANWNIPEVFQVCGSNFVIV